MKRTVIAGLVAFMVLSVLAISAYAEPPTDVEGTLWYTAHFGDLRVAGGNTFLTTTEDATWEGAFEGEAMDECVVVIHTSGAWFYQGMASFQGTVQGRTGTLQILLIGSRPDGLAEWEGTWRILSGGDELEHLHGQGTWWGPGAPDFEELGEIPYAGQIHFDP
jgi:hypothetical protein